MSVENIIQYISNFVYLYPLLMSFVWMVGGLIFYWRLERSKSPDPNLNRYPLFSILVPCHNEEKHIEKTVHQLLRADYPDFEIILIDDGSTDNTRAIIKELTKRHERVRAVYFEDNQGKATALNAGVIAAKAEFLLTMDADALLETTALKWIAWHFVNHPRVGAVTGNPRVLNRTSLLAKIQVGEYSTIIGLIKRTQRILGKVLTVSGVVAAFRKQALVSVGVWDTDMVTEDIDLTWKLEKQFWDIRYEPRCVCWILVPETIRGLWRQRFRWSQGGIEVLKKHKDIWTSWRQRRLWPVYLEYLASVLWAYAFWAFVLLWMLDLVWSSSLYVVSPIPPRWTGSILAFTCVVQFLVSIYVDRRYDQKMFKYLFWVIWYPFAYWAISSLTAVAATPKGLMKKKGVKAIWKSPDRGLA